MLLDTILDTTGRTPLVRLQRLGRETGATLALKLETSGPTQSIMDRVAARAIAEAEAAGELSPGATVVEAGAGNLGVALACACAVRGYRLVYVTCDQQSQEKLDTIKAFGGEVVICPAAVKPEDPRSRQSVAQRLSEETPRAVVLRVAEAELAVAAHREGTGPELWEATQGAITHVFCGVQSGAAITGIGAYLKERRPDLTVVAVEPRGSLVHDYWRSGRLAAEGQGSLLEEIGADQPPPALDPAVLDHVVQVSDRDAMRCARQLARLEGVLVGGAGGAVVAGALAWCRERALPSWALAVCVVPDHGGRYLSKVFNDRWLTESRLLDAPLELTAGAVVERKRQDGGIGRLLSMAPGSLVIEAVELMRHYGISQIPVIDEGEVTGSVKEGRLVHLLLADPNARSRPVEDALDEPFPVVSPSARVEDVSQLLTRDNPAVLVRYDDGLHIITKADLIRAIAP